MYFIQTHIAADARVTESAMLVDSMIGVKREVDVCIEVEVAGRTLLIGIECVAHTRKADLIWVEAMWAKHQCLATDRVVLVSKSGFTANAAKKAKLYHIEAVTPGESIPEDGPLAGVLRHQVQMREIGYGPLVKVEGWVERHGALQQIELATNWIVLRADGSRIGNVGEIVRSIADAAEQDGMREPVAAAQGNEKYLAYDRDGFSDAFLREETDPPTLLPLRRLRFIREARVCIKPVQLATGELEGTGYAAGKGTVVGHDAFVVLSEGRAGSKISVRFTDADGNVSDWLADREAQELRLIVPKAREDDQK
ncbi:hypothetical protein [Actinomadura macra]|uniref:hypothetical protein n=1 Tax=Actinomadura macra TaxID=46164 RepID=UPI000835BF4F|nr:hypothetical protein [Actinomadura macra]